VLIIEGIHGLNPKLTPHVAADMKFKIYVSALTSIAMDNLNRIATTDSRLIRRIVRDHRTRGRIRAPCPELRAAAAARSLSVRRVHRKATS